MIHKTVPINRINKDNEKSDETKLKEIIVPEPKVIPRKNCGAFRNLLVSG
jgi:hypothetical protein